MTVGRCKGDGKDLQLCKWGCGAVCVEPKPHVPPNQLPTCQAASKSLGEEGNGLLLHQTALTCKHNLLEHPGLALRGGLRGGHSPTTMVINPQPSRESQNPPGLGQCPSLAEEPKVWLTSTRGSGAFPLEFCRSCPSCCGSFLDPRDQERKTQLVKQLNVEPGPAAGDPALLGTPHQHRPPPHARRGGSGLGCLCPERRFHLPGIGVTSGQSPQYSRRCNLDQAPKIQAGRLAERG